MIGIPSGYVLVAKIGLVGALLLGVYLTGRHQGENAIQADWDRYKAQMIDAQSKLIAEHAKQIEDLREIQDTINVQESQKHQEAIDDIQKQHDADLAAIRANGLRIPRAACGSAIGPVTQTASNGGYDANASSTIALPEQTSTDLLALATEADRVAEVARACQSWVIKNGFYNAQ